MMNVVAPKVSVAEAVPVETRPIVKTEPELTAIGVEKVFIAEDADD